MPVGGMGGLEVAAGGVHEPEVEPGAPRLGVDVQRPPVGLDGTGAVAEVRAHVAEIEPGLVARALGVGGMHVGRLRLVQTLQLDVGVPQVVPSLAHPRGEVERGPERGDGGDLVARGLLRAGQREPEVGPVAAQRQGAAERAGGAVVPALGVRACPMLIQA
jgi:hypothetical protein